MNIDNDELTLTRKLDYIQAMIWARVKDEADKEGVKLTTGNCYGMGMVIKEVLHPEVKKLLAAQRQALRDEVMAEQIPVMALTAKKPHEEVQIQAVPIEAISTIFEGKEATPNTKEKK